MQTVRAVIFDFIGTLVNVENYSLEASTKKLYRSILESGIRIDSESFLREYEKAHQKYRTIRYEKLVEATNAVWLSESLNNLGFTTRPQDPHIMAAVNSFFEDYLNSLKPRPCTRGMLKKLSAIHKIGLVSNFTYAPVTYAALRKLELTKFFNIILVSEAVGWRKPHPKIFGQALSKLKVQPDEAVYVGDSPAEDITGAKNVGMRTIFVQSQFHSLKSLNDNRIGPDMIVEDICELTAKFGHFIAGPGETPSQTRST